MEDEDEDQENEKEETVKKAKWRVERIKEKLEQTLRMKHG